MFQVAHGKFSKRIFIRMYVGGKDAHTLSTFQKIQNIKIERFWEIILKFTTPSPIYM